MPGFALPPRLDREIAMYHNVFDYAAQIKSNMSSADPIVEISLMVKDAKTHKGHYLIMHISVIYSNY